MSITKPNEVTTIITRKARVSDNAGGYTDGIITTTTVTGRFIRDTTSKNSLNTAVPVGNFLVTRNVLVLPLNTDVKVNDTCTINNVPYRVHDVRVYKRSIQADIEAVN